MSSWEKSFARTDNNLSIQATASIPLTVVGILLVCVEGRKQHSHKNGERNRGGKTQVNLGHG